MNANHAFYLNNASIRFSAAGREFRAFVESGRVRLYAESSMAPSEDRAGLVEARRLLGLDSPASTFQGYTNDDERMAIYSEVAL